MNKKINRSNTKKYLLDGLLIVFSVLFALFINSIAENIRESRVKRVALQNIEKELQQNSAILKDWNDLHTEILNRIENLLEGRNDSLKTRLMRKDHLDLGLLLGNQSLTNKNITSTAWETAKSTGIISDFDFETTQQLTEVYMLQEVITERTLIKIFDYLFEPEIHDPENIESTLLQLQVRFRELKGQENFLAQRYKETLPNLKK